MKEIIHNCQLCERPKIISVNHYFCKYCKLLNYVDPKLFVKNQSYHDDVKKMEPDSVNFKIS